MKKFFVSEALLKQILARLEFGGPEWERDAEVEPVAWLPMDAAPKDGSLVLLLVEFEDHATEDGPGPHPTIGSNTSENDEGPDEWQFAGWNWEHDHYTQGVGTPVGWLPMAAQQPAPVQEPTTKVTWHLSKDGLPPAGSKVVGGHFYVDPWLSDETPTFSWGPCRVLPTDDPEFKDGKQWLTFGPSHNQITHWCWPPADPCGENTSPQVQQPESVREHLLAALKEVAETFGEDWREGSTQRRLGDTARAAIAKAESGAALAEPAALPATSNCGECRNADSWGIPDQPVCNGCASGSQWTPLNVSSVNPNAAQQPAPVQEPVAEITGVDEYGPLLGWHTHWAQFPVGAKLYTEAVREPSQMLTDVRAMFAAPQVQQPVQVQKCGYDEATGNCTWNPCCFYQWTCPKHPQPAPPADVPMLSIVEIADLTAPWSHVRSDYSIGIARAAEQLVRQKAGLK